MVSIGRTGKIYGVQIGARVAEKALTEYIDPLIPIGTGVAPHEKVSTWVQVVGGIALPMLAAKKFPQHEEMAQIFGGHMFSNVVDYAEYYLKQALAPAAMRGPQNVQQQYPAGYSVPQQYGPAPNAGMVGYAIKSPINNGARYART